MPKWCSNKLTVYGPEEDTKQFTEMAVGRYLWDGAEEPAVLNFHNLAPIPPAVLEAACVLLQKSSVFSQSKRDALERAVKEE